MDIFARDTEAGARGRRIIQVVAHRAAWHAAAEDTLAGLEVCIAQRYEWAEVDVRRTSDGHHVLLHDETLDRTTNGNGPVAGRPLDYVRQLSVHGDVDSPGRATTVPTLSQVLELARGRLRLYLDCRSADPLGLVRDVRDAGMAEDVMICIDPSLHAAVREAGGRMIPLVTFFDGGPDGIRAAVRDPGPAVVEVPAGRISADLVDAVRGTGAAVGALSMGSHDTPTARRLVMATGVDWIMTDFPGELRREADSFGFRGNTGIVSV